MTPFRVQSLSVEHLILLYHSHLRFPFPHTADSLSAHIMIVSGGKAFFSFSFLGLEHGWMIRERMGIGQSLK
jgi:hypothetical protein